MSGSDPRPDPGATEGRPSGGVLRPIQEFLSTTGAGATVLLAAAVVALVWANSPWQTGYERLWHAEVGAGSLRLDLRHVVNDGLMTLFFLLAGLEIRRELTSGELRDRRRAALPVLAALGGMAVPAVLYLAANAGHAGLRGWGMAMPTDMALVLGVLALVSPRVPTSLKVFVVTLAIADDVGTVAAVLLAYSRDVEAGWAFAAVAVVAAVVAMYRLRVSWIPGYLALGIALWLAMRAAGLNPTLAGVAMGLLVPAGPIRHRETGDEAPVTRAEHVLLPWVSFAVLPLFALANAGIELSAAPLSDPSGRRVAVGLTVARLVGKVAGIVGVSWLAVRTGVGRLPTDVGWSHLVGVGALAGIGFTVSLFVSGLAFRGSALSDAAGLGVLLSTVVSGAAGLAVLRWTGARSGSQAGPRDVPR